MSKLPADVVASCLGRVLDLTDRRAIAAADVAVQHHLAMADAVMYSLALDARPLSERKMWTMKVCRGLTFFRNLDCLMLQHHEKGALI